MNIYEADGGVSCPKCSKHWKYGEMVSIHMSRDYPVYFDMECDDCGAKVEVEVRATPEFSRLPPPRAQRT